MLSFSIYLYMMELFIDRVLINRVCSIYVTVSHCFLIKLYVLYIHEQNYTTHKTLTSTSSNKNWVLKIVVAIFILIIK